MIGRLKLERPRLLVDDRGEMTFTAVVPADHIYAAKEIMAEVKGKEKPLLAKLDFYRNNRSLSQNRLMWALLEIMAYELNGGRAGGVTAWDCYLDMLESYGAKFEYLECTKEAFPTLKEMFRAVKVVEERRKANGRETIMCKAFIGSSAFDTKEMTHLIDGIFDHLAEMGIEDKAGDVAALYEDWREKRC